ncbi:MAG: hypothetical protein ACLUSP_07905 [Christensenellales bacterium]
MSGGQRRRVVAMALSTTTFLCDEPTTALDVTIQALLELTRYGVSANS